MAVATVIAYARGVASFDFLVVVVVSVLQLQSLNCHSLSVAVVVLLFCRAPPTRPARNATHPAIPRSAPLIRKKRMIDVFT